MNASFGCFFRFEPVRQIGNVIGLKLFQSNGPEGSIFLALIGFVLGVEAGFWGGIGFDWVCIGFVFAAS